MSRYPGARWRGPVPNMTPGAMTGHRLFVLHIQEGTETGTDAWVHNPAAKVSAHFGNPKAGAPDQWVDTRDKAWAQAAYNGIAISIENEGNSGDRLTASQVENAAQILAWAHRVHGTKLQVTNDPNGEGVIGRGLLGVAGGNHPDCPGAPILAQRQAVVDRAVQILQGAPAPTPAPKELDVSGLPTLYTIDNSTEVWAADGGTYWHVADPKSMGAYKAAGASVVDITAAEHANRVAAFAKVSLNVTVAPAS